MTDDDNSVVVDKKLINKMALHKWVENGGVIKFDNLGVLKLQYNPLNPMSPFVELQLGFVPAGTKFNGNINPTLARAKSREQIRAEAIAQEQSKFSVEEDEEVTI